jgi:hypothetical protein
MAMVLLDLGIPQSRRDKTTTRQTGPEHTSGVGLMGDLQLSARRPGHQKGAGWQRCSRHTGHQLPITHGTKKIPYTPPRRQDNTCQSPGGGR